MSSSAMFYSLSLLFLIFSSSLISISEAGGEGSLTPAQCAPECNRRCSATSHRKPCLFYCNKCCLVCLCVPSGTYGHKEECPCYNNWKTKKGGPKCP